ncbi:MAG: DUF1330 domain-containing protein [Gammaproteobacteria bacterium]|nr:DUF1330 domain-containing protein [Gammaproteobacteria bacterium]MBQ09772.1 DUF1330 domain-containing protein [Gammaproteobacteria bacterium]MDP6146565.1 DUF1330 domain-containing protein [Gammaproteobacteria bacterium]HJL80230.1 DUF1330 domain-containing protein [Gammaproteobacteria bacterium]|tara:strand:- start:33435 stop:33854 length:420 start_codon:yes stop_codon:yes gene_type:complete
MKVANKLRPNVTSMAGFLIGDSKSTIRMVNLLKFKKKASYEDGRETDLTGKDAYKIYAKEVSTVHLPKVGGKIIFSGEVSRLLIGEVEDLWDMVAIAEYPNKKAMLKMISDKDYRESEKHRSAGLEGQLNIETMDQTKI